jgi:hypothetical protein
MANETVQACCPASHGANYIVAEALGKNLSAAIASTTDEASDGQVQLEPPTRTWQIGKHPRIATMNTPRDGSTLGASALFRPPRCCDNNRAGRVVHCFNVELGGD